MPARKTNKTLITEAVIPLMVAATRWLNATSEEKERRNAPSVPTEPTRAEKAIERFSTWRVNAPGWAGEADAAIRAEEVAYALEVCLSEDPMTEYGISNSEAHSMLDRHGVPRSMLGA
jgi:hypothetical protein